MSGFLRFGTVILAAGLAANALFLGRVAVAYGLAWRGRADDVARGAALVPFVADNYMPDLATQAGHLLDSEGRAAEALRHYRSSLEHDPYQNPLWLLIASAEERAGDMAAAERAYAEAERVEPRRPETYWMRANLRLRQGREADALADFRRVLASGRRFDEPVFDAVRRMRSPEKIETTLLPADGAADPSWFRVALRERDTATAARAWHRLGLARAREAAASEVDALCRLLAGASRDDEAWLAYAAWRTGAAATPLRNGGFEEEPAGAPFDWSFVAGPHLQVFRDTVEPHSGAAAVQVRFDGKEDFRGVALEQWVKVRPGRAGTLSLWWRARALSSDQAPRVELREPGSPGRLLAAIATEPGTSAWRHERAPFAAPTRALLRLIVTRAPSAKLIPEIGGAFWLDDVTVETVQ